MSLGPVSYLSMPLEDFPNYYLKFYEQGTTDPLEMATDATGVTLLAKAEISGGGIVPIGFIKTVGNAIFIPFVDGFYDAWLFPTAQEADNDNTTNAVQIADNVITVPSTGSNLVKEFDTMGLSIADTALTAGNVLLIKDRDSSVWDVVLAGSVNISDFDVEQCTGVPTLALVLRNSRRVISASMMGFLTETLFADTQTYKTIAYNVMRYTQNFDIQPFMEWFATQDRFDTFDFEDRKLYMSFVVIADFSGKHFTGHGGKVCGIIKGAINWDDGTKSSSVSNIGFFGEIDYLSLPLPVTIDPGLENDAGFFWYLDDLDFGFGFGALGAQTASSDGNTSDILVENCYFEMRDAIISGGGSVPNDEDRPKVHFVTFRNNESKGIMFHGFASIHFRYAKVYGNHFFEHYNGYACDFSLGTQDSSFFSNTGDRLAAGMKSEARSSDSSFGNKFYNNRLTLRYRWESTGAGFNIMFRTKSRETEMYNNTITAFDFTPIDSIALNIEGLSTIIRDNVFYLKGTPVGLLWFAQVKNGIDIPTSGQRLTYDNNKIFNQTLVSVSSGLQITTTDPGNNDWSIIEHINNEYTGLWGGMVNPEFAAVGDTIAKLIIDNNIFPNTQLFKAESAFTINILEVTDNTFIAVDNAVSVDLGFFDCSDKLSISENKGDYTATSSAGFVAKSNATGDISTAKLFVNDNKLIDLDFQLCYLFTGADVVVNLMDISGNSVIWDSTATNTPVVYGKGADTFTMHSNTLINRRATACFINRPSIASGQSTFEFNSEIGTFTDSPTP